MANLDFSRSVTGASKKSAWQGAAAGSTDDLSVAQLVSETGT